MKKKNNVCNENKIFNEIKDKLNEHLKKKIAFEVEPIKQYISTGSILLDYIISNKRDGGVPASRLTEILGLESSGKSLVALEIIKNTQLKEGIAVLVDTEHATSFEFMQRLGINIDRLIYLEPECIEDAFEAIEATIKLLKESYPDKLVTIVFDSVAACPAKAELEADYEQQNMGLQARAISKSLRKITQYIGKQDICFVFTNQLKMKIGGFNPHGIPQYVAPGGLALKYHSSVRIQLSRKKEIQDDSQTIVGFNTYTKCIKNKIAPPMRTCEFAVLFERGIDDTESILAELARRDYISRGGAWYTMGDYKFRKNQFREMLKNDSNFSNMIYEKLESCMIINYDKAPIILDVVDEDSSGDAETMINYANDLD